MDDETPAMTAAMKAWPEVGSFPPTECYILAGRRRDGGLPNPCKAIDDQLFWTVEDADEANRRDWSGYNLGVYRCLMAVVEEVPDTDPKDRP